MSNDNIEKRIERKKAVSNDIKKASSKKLHSKQPLEVLSESFPIAQYNCTNVAINKMINAIPFFCKNEIMLDFMRWVILFKYCVLVDLVFCNSYNS